MNKIRRCQKNFFIVPKLFLFKLRFITIPFFVCASIIGISTSSELPSYSSYLDGLQKLNNSDIYLKEDLGKIFFGSHEIANENIINSCDSR